MILDFDKSNISFFINKTIMITGGSGTIGQNLIDYFLKTSCKKIIIYSRDEFKHYTLKLKYNDERLRYFIGDIRDKDRLLQATKNVDILIHAAALKQVDTIEYNPYEAVKTNIIGSQNIVDCCTYHNIEQLVGISTDKCVEPINMYGGTKLCMEKIILSANIMSKNTNSIIIRYGNVVGSRGSVIPNFKKQLEKFTVTSVGVTRYTITIKEAINFIINSICLAKGGEIFVPKLQKYCLKQLCRVINPNNKIEIIGIRPGEKMHESMISIHETSYEYDSYYIIGNDTNITYNIDAIPKNISYSSEYAEYIKDDDLKKIIDELK